jgi:uncharacterized protein YbjQ (UPF0145 family)
MDRDILITSLNYVPNYKIIATKGYIYHYDYHLDYSLKKLKETAKKLGCNCILNVKMFIDCKENLVSYGDAAIIKKSEETPEVK